MENMLFTVQEAIGFSKGGRIEEWVHLFLNSIGDNVPFSDGLKRMKRYWTGPILIELEKLSRCCGPEPHMKFVQPYEEWEPHITRFQQIIRDGWDMPPLIVEHVGNTLVVNDGNHRLEAMQREGFEKCWAVIWNTDYQDNVDDFR